MENENGWHNISIPRMVEFSGCYEHRPTYYTDISSGPLGSVYSYKVKGEGYCFGFHNEIIPQGPNNGVFT